MKNNAASFKEIEQQFLASRASIFSLDCFDTLYWRKVSRPSDIFTRLQHGLCPAARMRAEASARGHQFITCGREEVTLAEIYTQLAEHFSPDAQRQMVERELALEIEHGFLFPPALALLRQAKARGMRTLIVSDTWYSAAQLGRILAAHDATLPQLIDHIYCSADYGYAKSIQLWPAILQREQAAPQTIFHIGDHPVADAAAPAALGIHAVHFQQNDAAILNLLEQRVLAASLLFPASRHTAPIPSLFHPCYSVALRGEIDGETLTAWGVLGPVLYAFARFIQQQRENIPGVKLGFLLRDGYMPHRAYQTLYPDQPCAQLHISRFTSICSAFHDKASIVAYLNKTLCDGASVAAKRITPSGFAMIARHLMLSAGQTERLRRQLEKRHYASDALCQALLAPEQVQHTLARSAAMRRRLIAHLQQALQLQPGDTLMLIDLGYSGTTQNLLAGLLEKALSIRVRGCYLIAAWVPGWRHNRTAMIDPDRAEYRTIRALTQFITPFEMLCSSHARSVVDYSATGEPVTEGDPLPPSLLAALRHIQQQALACVRLADEMAIPASQSLWDAAAIDLARYAYFPLADETRLQSQMAGDINMGTRVVRTLVDVPAAIDFMRRFGVTRLSMSESDRARTNFPSELRSCGVEYALSMFASTRFALNWSLTSSTPRQQTLEALFIQDAQRAQSETLTASSTFDGYFSLYIPLITPEVALLVGKTLRDMEIYRVSLTPQRALCRESEADQAQPLLQDHDFFIDGATVINNLALNLQEEGFLYFRPQQQPTTPSVIQLIYRPLQEK
ncbi:HAD family hydrolase [Pantoea latae]|uniref:Hydrolase n=1 Tax=Pantoea latae TaxID=1964541 RepID=A0A1V9DNL7_9GAMM|nr:HAD family hydrolase [Pantoea latae]OQP35436.1 hypothetical protein B2J69_05430 [Pantoea latae]